MEKAIKKKDDKLYVKWKDNINDIPTKFILLTFST